MTSLLLLRFSRYLLIPALILMYTLGVGFVGFRWGKAGAELAHAEAQLDLSQKIRRADERGSSERPWRHASALSSEPLYPGIHESAACCKGLAALCRSGLEFRHRPQFETGG
jgi:hypothetical protein